MNDNVPAGWPTKEMFARQEELTEIIEVFAVNRLLDGVLGARDELDGLLEQFLERLSPSRRDRLLARKWPVLRELAQLRRSNRVRAKRTVEEWDRKIEAEGYLASGAWDYRWPERSQ